MEEKENVPIKEPESESFWDKYKYYILVGLIILFGILAYTQGFMNSKVGIAFSILTGICVFILIAISIKSGPTAIFGDEFAKDPLFYYRYVKEYYSQAVYPRLSLNLTWTGKFMYYPFIQPTMLFFEVFDKFHQESLVAAVRIMKQGPQVRGLIKSSWKEFMDFKIFRLKMAGNLQSGGENITMIGRDGKPVTMPAEYFHAMNERGLF